MKQSSNFHYLDGLFLRSLFCLILFFSLLGAKSFFQEEKQKNALAQVISYTERSDVVSHYCGFDEDGTFLLKIKQHLYDFIFNS